MGSLLILVLALLAAGRSALGTQQDSFTVDEPWHIVAGTTYVRLATSRSIRSIRRS